MNEKPRQAKSIRAQLLTAMREGEYAHCDRLPRESVLSERLGTGYFSVAGPGGLHHPAARRRHRHQPPCLGGTGPHGH